MDGAEQSFKAYWASTVHPAIKDDFERLLSTTPRRIAEREAKKEKKGKKEEGETDRVHEKLTGVLAEVKEKGERRNAYMNLAWTGPIDNSFLQEKISVGKVENMAADMFLRSLPIGEAAETVSSSQEAADDTEPQPQGKAERRAVEILNEKARRPWQVPQMVERGFEIPIMITSGFVKPDLGKFKRLGMDVVVNAVWLAYFWAKQEGDQKAVTALETLIIDWPFDFILIEGSSDEEIEVNAFKWSVNMSTRVERLRDFVGLENANLLRIVARAADLVQAATVAHKKPSPEEVQKWLQENVKWGLLHCPDTKTVKRHLDNWAAIAKCPAALNLMEAAVNRWGRDNLLDWPTKLGIIVQKTDPTTLGYVVETLYTRMWRTGQKDPYACNALGDAVSEIIWVKNYVAVFLRSYPAVCDPGCNSLTSHKQVDVASMRLAQSYMHSPLKFFVLTEGPDKDPTWLQSFPNPATRLAMKHFFDMATGFYKPEISGALTQPKGQRYNVEQFHKGARVLKCFVEPFRIAYDSLVGSPKGSSQQDKADRATEAATADAAQGIGEEIAAENKKKTEVIQGQVDLFRLQCEKACQQEIDARVVLLVAEGSAVDVHASVTKTRLYHNMTEAATVMGFYDVKNARLCAVFNGESLTHREPVLDELDFERYLQSLEPLMVPGRDVLWVLGGRTETNRLKLKRILSKHKMRTQVFHLCYNTKQMMQYGHFQRQGGIANSRSHEMMYCCYKSRAPKQLAKTRQFVDPGTPVFNEVVRNVPVLSPKSHAMVSREIRETSLQAMIGADVTSEELKDPEYVDQPAMTEEEAATATPKAAPAEASKALVSAVKKKRKLYRQLTGTEVPWFPHDNAIDLIQELCHEAGRPRWVYFGTPAGGAGMHGCIEMGSSVLALCYDEHHRKNLGPFLVQRAVEAMLGRNTMVFNNESLLARAKQLNLAKEDEKEDKKEDEKEDKKEDRKEDRKEDEKQNKKEDEKNDQKETPKNDKKNDKKGKPKRKRTPTTSSGDFDSSSLNEAPKKKKGKTKA